VTSDFDDANSGRTGVPEDLKLRLVPVRKIRKTKLPSCVLPFRLTNGMRRILQRSEVSSIAAVGIRADVDAVVHMAERMRNRAATSDALDARTTFNGELATTQETDNPISGTLGRPLAASATVPGTLNHRLGEGLNLGRRVIKERKFEQRVALLDKLPLCIFDNFLDLIQTGNCRLTCSGDINNGWRACLDEKEASKYREKGHSGGFAPGICIPAIGGK
jgi:hypothetical protein